MKEAVKNIKKPNLGKLLKVGATFETSTKRMTKGRHISSKLNKQLTGPLMTYEVLRSGDKRFFTKGKRRYYCVVIGIVELRTGVYYGFDQSYTIPTIKWERMKRALRWYQFHYLVQVLEN